MVVREKMTRQERAKQFAPFDALKGLHEAISLKEFEHEMISRNEASEDEIKNISSVLSKIEKRDKVDIKFFREGHIVSLVGVSELDIFKQEIKVGAFVVKFEDIKEINIIKNAKNN